MKEAKKKLGVREDDIDAKYSPRFSSLCVEMESKKL